jgi:hypothetical protein
LSRLTGPNTIQSSSTSTKARGKEKAKKILNILNITMTTGSNHFAVAYFACPICELSNPGKRMFSLIEGFNQPNQKKKKEKEKAVVRIGRHTQEQESTWYKQNDERKEKR